MCKKKKRGKIHLKVSAREFDTQIYMMHHHHHRIIYIKVAIPFVMIEWDSGLAKKKKKNKGEREKEKNRDLS